MIPNKWHSSWNDFMTKENINLLKDIEKKIGNDYYPSPKNVLRFLQTDLNNIKCVIVGMEPYPTSYIENNIEIPIATGRSFEISMLYNKNWDTKFKQSSLRNILKTIYYNKTNEIISLDEIRTKIAEKEFKILPPKALFDNLEQQGVLFLNATLTVQKNKVDSHTKYWKEFMEELIKFIDSKQNIKWLLWGDKAQNRILPIINKNNAICTVHPRIASFVEQNCFKEITSIRWDGM